MKPLDLKEWAESLYAGPDAEAASYASEILDLIACGERLAVLEDLAKELEHAAPGHKEEWRALEWLSDRQHLLVELEDTLKTNGFEGDADDALAALLNKLATLEEQVSVL